MVLCNTDDNAQKKTLDGDIGISQEVAAIVLISSAADRTIQAELDCIILAGAVDSLMERNSDAILIDERPAMTLTSEAMFERDYQRVAHIAGPDGKHTDERTQAWFQTATHEGSKTSLKGPLIRKMATYRVLTD